MPNFKSEFMNLISERGFIHQSTDPASLDKTAKTPGTIKAYIGFDCTAKSLHVGSLLSIMALRHLQKSGHKPIVLLGNGTTKIGDPSGKDESRSLLTDDDITKNMRSIQKVFKKFLLFGDGPTDAMMIDWTTSGNANADDGLVNHFTMLGATFATKYAMAKINGAVTAIPLQDRGVRPTITHDIGTRLLSNKGTDTI